VAIALVWASLRGYLTNFPPLCMLAVAAVFLWWRGPGWRAIGLRRPESWPRAIAVGVALSLYQFPGTYLVEPVIARLTTGALPDVSAFRPLVGNESQLLFWLAVSWTLAAFVEEMVFRGWITARIAELTGFTRAAWVLAIAASSVMFGLMHLYQGASGMIATGLTGAIFGAAYLASGRNLWCAIIAHGLTDTLGFVMIYLGVYPGL
jgi:membrane protease YdiL (CAAX protease family)